MTPNIDEEKEIARGNRAVAEYFGRVVFRRHHRDEHNRRRRGPRRSSRGASRLSVDGGAFSSLRRPFCWSRPPTPTHAAAGMPAGGTPVETPRGAIAIERLSAGDPVVTFDRGRFRQGRVVATTGSTPGRQSRFRSPGRDRCDGDPSVRHRPGVFRAADRLRAGDTLFLWDRGALRPVPVLAVRRIPGAAIAYDLLVDRGGAFLATGLSSTTRDAFSRHADPPPRRDAPNRSAICCRGDRVLAFREDAR